VSGTGIEYPGNMQAELQQWVRKETYRKL